MVPAGGESRSGESEQCQHHHGDLEPDTGEVDERGGFGDALLGSEWGADGPCDQIGADEGQVGHDCGHQHPPTITHQHQCGDGELDPSRDHEGHTLGSPFAHMGRHHGQMDGSCTNGAGRDARPQQRSQFSCRVAAAGGGAPAGAIVETAGGGG